MKKNKRLIIIPIIIVILLIIIVVFFINKKEKTVNEYEWKIIDNVDLPEGFYRSKLDKVDKSLRCIDDICIDNVVITFNQSSGEISYDLTNNTKKKIKDAYYFLKLSNDDKLLIYAKKIKKGETYQGKIYFSGKNMYNVNSYKLVKLTDKELKNVK